MKVEWRPVPGFEKYAVSNYGDVISWKYGRFVYISPAPDINGYHRANLYRDKKRIGWHVHVLVLMAFTGPKEEGQETRHLDGNPANNFVENLKWGTARENMEDRKRHGTNFVPPPMRGIANNRAKLTDEQVIEIRASNEPRRALAKRYGVHFGTITGIRIGRYRKFPCESAVA